MKKTSKSQTGYRILRRLQLNLRFKSQVIRYDNGPEYISLQIQD